MVSTDDRDEEIGRLWSAFRRNLTGAILEFMGAQDGKASERLDKAWARLCEMDLDVAANIYHGVEQVYMLMARHDQPYSPADHHMRQLGELAELVRIGREANPDAEVRTVGELMDLGEKEIQRQVDDETGEA